ncbi:MAG: hypothetical protein ACFFDN_10260 [Candidatus Hodarchaeota archaeon]
MSRRGPPLDHVGSGLIKDIFDKKLKDYIFKPSNRKEEPYFEKIKQIIKGVIIKYLSTLEGYKIGFIPSKGTTHWTTKHTIIIKIGYNSKKTPVKKITKKLKKELYSYDERINLIIEFLEPREYESLIKKKD